MAVVLPASIEDLLQPVVHPLVQAPGGAILGRVGVTVTECKWGGRQVLHALHVAEKA